MIRQAASATTGLGRVLKSAAVAVLNRAVGFCTRAWQRHSELMEESTPYRQQLALVITAMLGLMRLHPSFAVVAATLGALYVSAYQRRAEPAYERSAEPVWRPTEDRSPADLRLRFHDKW